MNNLLIVIPYCKDDAERAEGLIDWIFHLNGRKPMGHALVAAAPDVHAENVERIKISASVTFDSFDSIRVKNNGLNQMFAGIARHICKSYRVPFFWMEPDCTPLKPSWYRELQGAYYAQPKRYCGSIMRNSEKQWSARCICYPPDAALDLDEFCKSNQPFNISAAGFIIPAITKTTLVGESLIDSATLYSNIPDDAVAVHSDKLGIALKLAEERYEQENQHRLARTITA